MKINIVEREGYSNRIMNWKIYVRKDLTVAKASEYYYEFIEENSFRPVSELVLPEDGELLKEAVAAELFAPLELMTVLSNLKDSTRNVYLRMEQSEQTEDGIPLYQITLSDLHDLENRTVQLEQSILKYRHFMTLEDVYYFEYLIDSDYITVYKYVNERAMNQFEGPLKDLIRMEDLEPYPYIYFEKGESNSFYFAEEVLSTFQHKKSIRVTDRATCFNLILGLNGYTPSAGIYIEELGGGDLICKPLALDETIHIGAIAMKDSVRSEIGRKYLEFLKKYLIE